jgi:Flagellar hook-length control protein FliK
MFWAIAMQAISLSILPAAAPPPAAASPGGKATSGSLFSMILESKGKSVPQDSKLPVPHQAQDSAREKSARTAEGIAYPFCWFPPSLDNLQSPFPDAAQNVVAQADPGVLVDCAQAPAVLPSSMGSAKSGAALRDGTGFGTWLAKGTEFQLKADVLPDDFSVDTTKAAASDAHSSPGGADMEADIPTTGAHAGALSNNAASAAPHGDQQESMNRSPDAVAGLFPLPVTVRNFAHGTLHEMSSQAETDRESETTKLESAAGTQALPFGFANGDLRNVLEPFSHSGANAARQAPPADAGGDNLQVPLRLAPAHAATISLLRIPPASQANRPLDPDAAVEVPQGDISSGSSDSGNEETSKAGNMLKPALSRAGSKELSNALDGTFSKSSLQAPGVGVSSGIVTASPQPPVMPSDDSKAKWHEAGDDHSSTAQPVFPPAGNESLLLVSQAHLLHRPEQTDIRIEMQAGPLGGVALRAHMAGNQIDASIVAEHHTARTALANDLPALHSALAEKNVVIGSLHVAEESCALAGGGPSGGSGQRGPARRTQKFTPFSTNAASPAAVDAVTGPVYGIGGPTRLSVLA